MRIFTVFTVAVFSVSFFGIGAVLVAQGPGGQARQIVVTQADGTQLTVSVPEQRSGGPRGGEQQDGVQMMQGGGPPQRMQPSGMQPPVGRGATAAGQGNQPPARPTPPATGQPSTMNPNQVTQAIARLRAMDTNQNGVLEAAEIPANQRERVNAMVTQLGGNPNSTSFNLANLERRAMTTAGGQPNQQQPNQQQQGGNTGQQQRQQATPLVPTFGERVTAEAPPVMFGQSPPVVQTSASQGTRQGGRQQGGANQQGAVPPPVTVKISTPYDNISAALRNNQEFKWFFEADTDQDGQLTMQEFVQAFGGVWTDTLAGEFAGFGRVLDSNSVEYMDVGLDRNGDGFATLDEALITVKEKTERRTQETAAAQTAMPARPQGRQSPVAIQNTRMQTGNTAGNQTEQLPTSANNQGSVQQLGRQQGYQPQMGGRNSGGRGGRGSGGQ